ncbi:hypothetical protein LVJ94_02390 [Pendulispora rubella]|uniref:Triacylglycerol lipase n=1 Tax=Pendulispora rubella TaxID=2741070 RepID=A0ABZ2L585_9BACT
MKTFLIFGAVLAVFSIVPPLAHADPLTTGETDLLNNCKPTVEKPYPVVLVHGQAGDYHGMGGVWGRLIREGYCVYATNYGLVEGGANGQDHLWISAEQISGFIDGVLQKTGAEKVDVVGHSAGTGVLDHYVLKKGGASKVHAFVSFGGLHHPYAHLGVPRFVDFDVYLPELLAFGQRFFPTLTVRQVADTLVSTFGLDPGLAATVRSPFAEDLFDANYWNDLHGGPSEPPGTFLRLFTNGRTLPTHDSDSSIVYTNIVGATDVVVGGSTGWQDQSANIENFLLTSAVTLNTHNDMLGDESALLKMLEGLRKNTGNGFAGPRSLRSANLATMNVSASETGTQKEFESAFLEAIEREHGPELHASSDEQSGCSLAPRRADESWVALLVLGALVIMVRQRRSVGVS